MRALASGEPVPAARDEGAAAAAPSAAERLAAERDAHVARARALFGDKTPIAIEADAFVLVETPGWGPGPLASSLDLTKRALVALYHGRFRARPAHAVAVYLFASDAPYHAYCRERTGAACISPYGFYQPTTETIIMNAGPGLGTLTHEIVHPIVRADFPDAPTWIDEGLASLFEQPILPRPGEIHGGRNWRLPRLLAALGSPAERDDVRVEKLFALSDAEFRGAKESRNYALARYFCQWLDERKLLWDFYAAWRDGYANDKSGERAFERVVGKTPADANADFVKWVRGG